MSNVRSRGSGPLLTVALLALTSLGSACASEQSYQVYSEQDLIEGWRITGVARHPEYMRYRLQKGDLRTAVEITYRRQDSPGSTRYYLVQPAPGERPPPILLNAVRRRLVQLESLPGHQRIVRPGGHSRQRERKRSAAIAWLPLPSGSPGGLRHRATANTTLALQGLMLLGCLLLAWRMRYLARLAHRISAREWWFFGGCTAVGVILRLLGGVRVPGFTNAYGYGHGFQLLRDVLVHDPLFNDPHGNGFHALHGLTLTVLPTHELSVIAVQLALSVLCVPLTYVVARFWLGDRRWACWSAAAMAVLPVPVFFAATEVRLVPGVFFMLLTLAAVGVATRDRHWITLCAAAILAAVTTQFYPTLLAVPLMALLLLLSRPEGRALLRLGRTWWATGLMLALWASPTIYTVHLVATQKGSVVGSDFLMVFERAGALFWPSRELLGHQVYNTFLNSWFTPPTLALLAGVGLVTGLLRRSHRVAVLSLLGCALLLTLLGLFPGRMNLARLQQSAFPFYAMLVGVGLGVLVEQAERLGRRFRRAIALATGTVVLLGSIAIWPGPIGARYTLQWERRAFADGVAKLKTGCVVIWPPGLRGTNRGIPSYLAETRQRGLVWGAIPGGGAVPRQLLVANACVYYYRPSACYTLAPGERRTHPIRRECRRIESGLELEAVSVKPIPSQPDDLSDYYGSKLLVGFFRIKALRSTPTAPPPGIPSAPGSSSPKR